EPHKMHGEKDQIGSGKGEPEMQVTGPFAHHATIHLREPVINTGKHAEDRGTTHYQVKVSNYKISVVKINIQRRIPQPYPRKSAGNKEGNHTNCKQHLGGKMNISPPKCSNVIEGLH